MADMESHKSSYESFAGLEDEISKENAPTQSIPTDQTGGRVGWDDSLPQSEKRELKSLPRLS